MGRRQAALAAKARREASIPLSPPFQLQTYRKNVLKNIISSISKTTIVLGLTLHIVQGTDQALTSDTSTNSTPVVINRPATAADFDPDKWRVWGIECQYVNIPQEKQREIELKNKIIPEELISQGLKLKPACSILMNNGGQIDYIPGVAALWICRDSNLLTTIITGEFLGKDLYNYSAEEFARIISHTEYVCISKPVHVTFSNTGEFPIKHPTEIRNEIITKWFS